MAALHLHVNVLQSVMVLPASNEQLGVMLTDQCHTQNRTVLALCLNLAHQPQTTRSAVELLRTKKGTFPCDVGLPVLPSYVMLAYLP